MAEQDVQQSDSQRPGPLLEPSESLISEERLSLLPPDLERGNPNYKSIDAVTTIEEPYREEGEALGLERGTKSVIGILSLLLIGNCGP